MSIKELAEVFRISAGTVKSRLNRARNRLKKLIEETV
jgi:DNA-directed RNA polymerase specialized sigma24 family protein